MRLLPTIGVFGFDSVVASGGEPPSDPGPIFVRQQVDPETSMAKHVMAPPVPDAAACAGEADHPNPTRSPANVGAPRSE